MNRLTDYTLAGVTYKLNLSTRATKLLVEKFGDLENICRDETSTSEMLDNFLFILFTLIEQGAAYEKITSGIEGNKIALEDLEVLIGIPDLPEIQRVVTEAMSMGSTQTVEVDGESKKAQSAQN